MSEGLNKVQLLGGLGADPELKFTKSGQAVLNMRVATSERYKTKEGEWKDKTEWHNAVLWGARAEALGKFLKKGAKVFIEGSLRTTSYEGKDGSGKRYRTEVNASNVILLGGSRESKTNGAKHTTEDAASFDYGANEADAEAMASANDDIPF